MANNVYLGNEAEDVVTGYRGIVTVELRRLEGTIEYGLTPKCKNGEGVKIEYFDSSRVQKISDSVLVNKVKRVMRFQPTDANKTHRLP